jgi:hypothetical protein
MNALRISTILCICFVLGVAMIAATASADSRPELEKNIREAITDLSCDTDDDCSFIPFGSKPCGGPWKYMLFSRKTTNEQALIAMTEKYNMMDKYYNEKNEMLGDCRMVMPPAVSCGANKICNGSGSVSQDY